MQIEQLKNEGKLKGEVEGTWVDKLKEKKQGSK